SRSPASERSLLNVFIVTKRRAASRKFREERNRGDTRWPIALAHIDHRGGALGAKSGASNVSSKHDPILLLEPSNLLEPLSMEDRYGDPAVPRLDREEIAPRGTARPIRRQPTVASSPHANLRWRFKAALVVVGGLACFGAGAAMPMLPNLVFGDAKR